MIRSMTAFGRGRMEYPERDVTVEMRSVNSRFFDFNVRLPRAYMCLEDRIRTYVQKNAVSRAKVDLYLTVEEHAGKENAPVLDEAYAAQYLKALYELRDTFSLRDDISVMSVARVPDVFRTVKDEEDPDKIFRMILPALDACIDGYVAMRTAEGERAFADLCTKVEHLGTLLNEVEEISKTDTVGYRDKLEARIRKILEDQGVEIDENRLLTECAIWQDKIAIDEELVRLRSHFKAFYEIAALAEPSGRKLDFLVQEMNRETNTIGSKANNARIARIVVDMKGELEKIREQIQNIE